MRAIVLSLIVIFSGTISVSPQDVEIVTKDGRTVILKSNGTWEIKKETTTQPTPTSSTDTLNQFNQKLPFSSFSASKIPFGFRGHDVREILLILQERFLPKDEFETTINYEKRIANAKTVPIYDGLPLDSWLVITERSSPYSFIDDEIHYVLKYNADLQRMSVTLKAGGILNDYVPEVGIVEFQNLSPYLLGRNYEPRTLSFDFSVDAEKAKALKENLNVLYIFKLKPFTTLGSKLKGDLSEIWFYGPQVNGAGSEVLHKLKVNDLKTTTQKE